MADETADTTSSNDGEIGTTEASTDVANGSLDVVSATLPWDWVQNGSYTTVRATIENPDDEVVTDIVPISIDGERVTARTLTLDPGERATVEIRFEATREGQVAVDGVEAGQLEIRTVAEEDTPTSSSSGGVQERFQEFLRILGVLVVVLIVVSLVLAAYSRTTEPDE